MNENILVTGRRMLRRMLTSRYLISSSLCHDSQECLIICCKNSLNSEAVVLTAMVYYGERMPNRTSKGKTTMAEVEESRMESPPSQGMPHRMCSCLQQLNIEHVCSVSAQKILLDSQSKVPVGNWLYRHLSACVISPIIEVPDSQKENGCSP